MEALQSLFKFKPKKDYIINKTGLAWLKIDIPVPTDIIHEEYKKCTNFLVKHRAKDSWAKLTHKGWRSATLYGVDSSTTTNSNLKHNWTDLSEQCPETTNWIKENFIINEKTGRIRFMLLEPGGYILPHSDKTETGLQGINVAITQPIGCTFRFLDRGTIPFRPGDAFIIDTSNRHLVWNNSNEYRLHMILHAGVPDKVIENSYANCFYST